MSDSLWYSYTKTSTRTDAFCCPKCGAWDYETKYHAGGGDQGCDVPDEHLHHYCNDADSNSCGYSWMSECQSDE